MRIKGGEHTALYCRATCRLSATRAGSSTTDCIDARISDPLSTIAESPLRVHILVPDPTAKMSVQLPPPTHRKRTLPQGELEAASTLKLGADQNTHTLSLSEARLVIHKVLENKRRGGNKYEEPEYVGRCPPNSTRPKTNR